MLHFRVLLEVTTYAVERREPTFHRDQVRSGYWLACYSVNPSVLQLTDIPCHCQVLGGDDSRYGIDALMLALEFPRTGPIF